MALFGNSHTDESSPMADQTSTVQDQVNLVGEGTVFEGTLRAKSDVRASGKIIGTLDVDGKAMVAESGTVEGEILATNADIAGQVEGEIHVEERLVLKSTAQVDGKVETDRLVVEEGAQFSGECEMGSPISSGTDSSDGRGSSGSSFRPEATGTTDDSSETSASVSSVDEDEE